MMFLFKKCISVQVEYVIKDRVALQTATAKE